MSGEPRWRCLVCGYIHSGSSPPNECPVCGSPFTAFQQTLALETETLPEEITAPKPEGFRFVIIGNSAAGRAGAKAIRAVSPNADITVISEETTPIYYRPLLPDYIGGMPESKIFRAAESAYKDNSLTLLAGERVTAIDPAAKIVKCASGLDIAFDSLLIASGSTPVMIPWPGSDAEGIAYFRTFEDARRISELASNAKEAVVIGGGLLGLEFVRAFLARGIKVTMIVREERVGAPGLDPDAGSIVEKRLSELGVNVLLQEEAESFEQEKGRVKIVKTNRGRALPCDVVGVAVGAKPRIDFLSGSGIETDRGVLVDERFMTNIPNIYAAGDAAQAPDLVYGSRRVNTSWRTASEQGWAAGCNMAGAEIVSEGTIGSNFQVFGGTAFYFIGMANPADETFEIEKKLDIANGTYRKLVRSHGRLVGAALVGDVSEASDIEREIRGIKESRTKPETKKETKAMKKMTEENLKAAFAGESQAHMKYMNFAEKAKQEQKPNVARLFEAASYAEQVHASKHLKVLSGIGTTSDNLAAAINGEGFEVDEMYPAYMAVAEMQGESAAKQSFYAANEAEKVHHKLYEKAKAAVDAGRDAEIGNIWVCSVCGFTGEGDTPDECPICASPKEKIRTF